MKKILCVVLFFVATQVLHAETEMRMRQLENRVNNLEKNQGKINPQYDPITPNAGPKVYDGMDMFLTVDFIFWTARLDTLTYAKTGIGNLITNPSKGQMHSVDWSWDPGFKVGYGWTFCHGGWDLYLQYTWFYSNVADTKHAQGIQPSFQILPPIVQFLNTLITDRAHAHWDLHYQVGDLELGRNYYINRYLKLRPFVGLKGTWQKQDYNVFFEGERGILPGSPISGFKAHIDQMLWGIGMRAGLNTAWQFNKYISLYGDFALTGMWIDYDLDRKDTLTENIQGPQPLTIERTTANLEETLQVVKPVFEFGIGLRFEGYFHCNRLHARFQAGWETHIWPNQTLYPSITSHYDRFDLSLQGLTTKFRLDF